MNPKIKFENGVWLCGGLLTFPWYIDWYQGDTIQEAYNLFERATKNKAERVIK